MRSKKSFFVIGDSISIQYGPYLKKMVKGIFNCGHKSGVERRSFNDSISPVGVYGGDSKGMLKYLKQHLKEIKKYDILFFNCGLHDIRVNPKTQKTKVNIQKYEKNLNTILRLIYGIKVYPIWVSTTPVDDDRHNAIIKGFKRYDKNVIEYNNAAKRVMGKNNAPIIDLYTFSKNLGKDIYCDNVHFKEEIRALQAAFIAGRLFGFR